MLWQNTSDSARRWDNLQRDGHTLELAPGEACELDLPEDFEDAWLKPVKAEQPAEPVSPPPENPQLADAQAELAKAQADVAAAEAAQ